MSRFMAAPMGLALALGLLGACSKPAPAASDAGSAAGAAAQPTGSVYLIALAIIYFLSPRLDHAEVA